LLYIPSPSTYENRIICQLFEVWFAKRHLHYRYIVRRLFLFVNNKLAQIAIFSIDKGDSLKHIRSV